jgi:hypothetical protein
VAEEHGVTDEEQPRNLGCERILKAVSASSLSVKQQAFVVEYIANGFNATKAAKAAGYSGHTADRQGSRLLKNVEISAAIRDALKATGVRAEALIERLTAIALEADLADYGGVITGEISLSKLRALGVDTRLIRSLKPVLDKEGNVVTNVVTLHDPARAAATLLKHLGVPEEVVATREPEPPGYELPSVTHKRLFLEFLNTPPAPGLPVMIPLELLKEFAQIIDKERAHQLVEDLHAGRLDEPEEQEQAPVERAESPAEVEEPRPVEPSVGGSGDEPEGDAAMPPDDLLAYDPDDQEVAAHQQLLEHLNHRR